MAFSDEREVEVDARLGVETAADGAWFGEIASWSNGATLTKIRSLPRGIHATVWDVDCN